MTMTNRQMTDVKKYLPLAITFLMRTLQLYIYIYIYTHTYIYIYIYIYIIYIIFFLQMGVYITYIHAYIYIDIYINGKKMLDM